MEMLLGLLVLLSQLSKDDVVVFISQLLDVGFVRGLIYQWLYYISSIYVRTSSLGQLCLYSGSKSMFLKEMKEAFTFYDTPECDLVHLAECMHHGLKKVRHHKVNIEGNVMHCHDTRVKSGKEMQDGIRNKVIISGMF